MNKKRILICTLLALTAFFSTQIFTGTVNAAKIPTFEIQSVKSGESITIVTKDMPANLDFKALMGEAYTMGINGLEVGSFNSAAGGSLSMTLPIPAALKDRAIISVRLQSVIGGYYSYNWFNNKAGGSAPATTPVAPTPGTTPAPTTPPATTPGAPISATIPTFTIIAVKQGNTVTIKAINFPKNTDFTVLMGKMWTMGIGGKEVATFNSGAGGSFEATYTIPADLANLERIAIRLQGKPWYAYNWFWNFDADLSK